MGKVSKKASEKHNVSLSPALAEFIKQTASISLADLPSHLASLPTRWPFPRGDLYNWIEPLDRFDSILQKFNTTYGLDTGPQTQNFGTSLILEDASEVTAEQLQEKGFGLEGDRELVQAILAFSRLLLEKCGNRALYNSTDRLNDLLNTTSLDLLHGTLRLTIFLAQRYAERSTTPPQPHSSFYSFDQEKLHKLASSFASPASLAGKRIPTSPSKSTKAKEKPAQSGRVRRSSTLSTPNDFRSLIRVNTASQVSGKSRAPQQDSEWQSWAVVKVVWTPHVPDTNTPTGPGQDFAPDDPGTPTPVRRPSSMLSRTTTSVSMTDADAPSTHNATAQKSGLHIIDLTANDLIATTPEAIIQECPADMPQAARYELLHKLRIAYGLITSANARQLLLQIRLLALATLAYIYDETEFPQKVFGVDSTSTARQQLIHQITSLLQENKKTPENVPIYLQTLAMETMGVLARQRAFANEIMAALAPNSSHGMLLLLIQKALKDLEVDGDDTDNEVGDDWREAIFSLLSAFMIHGIHSVRSSETVIHPSLVSAYGSGLKVMTNKALRVHLRILDFMKTFFHHFKDGLATLSATHAFDAACNLLDNLTKSSLDLLQKGEGIRAEFKTKVTDYEIPYMHQQVIRSMIDLVNDIISHQGGHAERILRNLVDSSSLLDAFRSILSKIDAFGAHTWSEVVKAIVGFLHNEPTSYTIISEAGITRTLLGTMISPSQPSSSSTPKSISAAPARNQLTIPAVADAIVNMSQAFGAICLTNAGFEFFKSSGALERFFEIFENPAHVKVIKDTNTLALLGSTFDELVRHHPTLRDSVLSNVITMVARVRYICRSKAWQIGAGAKLWLENSASNPTVAGGVEALTMETVPQNEAGVVDYKPLQLPNGDSLDVNGPSEQVQDSIVSSAKDVDADGLTVVDYARPAICFLMNFFENQALCTSFMEAGASDLILDFTTLSSYPPNEQMFGATNAVAHELTNLVHMMAETKPHLILPAVVDRIRYACDTGLTEFMNSQPKSMQCFFDSMIRRPKDDATLAIKEAPESIAVMNDGTKYVKSLTTVLILVQVLAEAFNIPIYSTRSSTNTLFTQVNVADMLADTCRSLGLLSAACYREEIALQRTIPESWLPGTRPGNFTSGDHEIDKILRVVDGSSPTGLDKDTQGQLETKETQNTERADSLKTDKQTAAYKNAQTLRYLLIETPVSITEFFLRLGRGIVSKRRQETYTKQKSALVADALAEAYIAQLQPAFLTEETPTDDDQKQYRFSYLCIALSNIRGSLYDDSQSLGPSASRQAFVVDAFRRAGGLKVLTRIGTEFFDELESCRLSQSVFSANAGLKICLDIFDDLTNTKNIVESNQASFLRTTDPTRSFYFNPSQLLLELRMEALPLTRKIWDSDYADQASNDLVQKLVSILKNVFNGDHEVEAVQNIANQPNLSSHMKRKYRVDMGKLSTLREKGYPEDLAREALYRCNIINTSSSLSPAEEYCKAIQDSPRRRRLPIPLDETESTSLPGTSGIRSPAITSLNTGAFLPGGGSIEATLAEVAAMTDNDMEDVDDPDDDEDDDDDDNENNEDEGIIGERAISSPVNAASAMNINNILNRPETLPVTQTIAPSRSLYSVQTIDAERESIREDLAERCNNILNNHQNLTFELSELIVSASKKLSDGATKSFWENTSDLLVNSLLSMQTDDEMTEPRAKKIAAAAHLIALLIQDDGVFKTTLKVFQDSFDGLASFLRLPSVPVQTIDESMSSAPWVAPVLLILERMLSLDAEPPEVKWSPPSDMEPANQARVDYRAVFSVEQKKHIYDLLISILPKVGKDKSMGLSVIRILVILTRNREIAVMQGEKGNLQRLFLMVKQLGNAATGRLQSSFMLILRHIIEDENTIKQIMRSEITATLNARSTNRQLDLNTFVRDSYHLVLRSPELFVEVANETIKFSGWASHTANQGLVLRDSPDLKALSSATAPDLQESSDSNSANKPAMSIEDQGVTDKAKPHDIKPPVVENPDGVIHFLLSELLAYKDVDDRDPPANNEIKPAPASENEKAPENSSQGPSSSATSLTESIPGPADKPEKPKFKADDHPIYIYRCFILHCLTELLYSYNRTKIEFINFSRKADPMGVTPSKPRSGVLNYVLNALVCSGYVDKDDTALCRKRMTTSDWAMKVVAALCTKTSESGVTSSTQRYSAHTQVDDQDTEPDLTFVRRFTLEHAIKSFKDATSSSEPLQVKYSRLLCLADLFHKLLTKPNGPEGSGGMHNNSYKMLGRMMFEKNLVAVLTSSLAEIDLSFPSSKKAIKFILRPLQELTTLAAHLSLNSPDAITSAMGNDVDDVISSASSVSLDDDREETPDLFRNSALGILDPSRQDTSDTSEDDEDQEMYDEEYEDEMEYDDALPAPNDGEVVSDEEIDEGLEDAGPIEGIPGDHPMDIEFVMDDPLDMPSGSDDEETSSDDDDEDDDDDENEDFEIEMADDGELHGDNDDHSLGEGLGDEDGWEDEEDEDEEEDDDEDDEDNDDEEAEVAFAEDLPIPYGLASHAQQGTHAELNNLLRVLGEQDLDAGGPTMPNLPTLHQQMLVEDDEQHAEDDPDDEEDNDGMENEAEIEGFDFDWGLNLNDGPDDMDGGEQWEWNEPPTTMFRRHRHPTAPGLSRGQLPFSMGRRIHALDSDLHHHIMGSRHHRHAPAARAGADDGTNPLLQRPDTNRAARLDPTLPYNVTVMTDNGGPGMPGLPGGGNMISMQIPIGAAAGLDGSNFGNIGGHGAVIDALLNAIGGGGGRQLHTEGLRFSIPGPGDIHEMLRNVVQQGRSAREEPGRFVAFIPTMTSNRWQEEARLLFGNTYIDKLQRVQILLMSKLVPLAQEEEKARRQKKAEDDERRKKEAEELEKQRIVEDRLRKQREEREAAEKAEAEARARADAEAAAAARGSSETTQDTDAGNDAMEGVESLPIESTSEQTVSAAPAPETRRVFTTIRGRQLDITGLDIDLDYLEAIPEELREEVIMTQYTQRRETATQNPVVSGNNDAESIDPDFLDALPEDIREEIRQQEILIQRRRDREAARRQQAAAGAAQAEEMDNDNFLATLDPALRRAILAEQPPEILQQLDPIHAAEGRAHQRGLLFHRMGEGRDRGETQARRETGQKEKRQVVQLIDKAGVATLLRLMFLPQQGSLKSNLWHILTNVCGNRQTRFEVISLLLIVLKEGSTDVTAVERSLASLSLRARASGAQKTPQPLKRTLSMQPQAGLSEEMTPMIVVQQCLAALQALCRTGFHVKSIFLREVDVNATKLNKKGKGKENKTTKYPINDLIGLLDRRLIMESSGSLQALSEVLASVTQPLKLLMQKPYEQPKEVMDSSASAPDDTTAGTVETVMTTQETPHASQDTNMAEAPAVIGQSQDTSTVSGENQPTEQEQQTLKVEEESKEEALKKKQPFEPPMISDHNLQLITSVFVAPECHNETFHFTLETLQSLSCISGTSTVFSKELINHVQVLSQAIGADLDELLPLIREAQSTSDLQGITSVKFSASSSEQVKLLRVLQALDFLSAPKKDGDTNNEAATVKSILNSSYDTLSLGPLWHKLSECLTAVREKGDTIGFANILLPLIESLMVVCKNTPLRDVPVAGQLQEAITSPKPEGMNDLEELFFNFTAEHRKILNDIVRQNPKLMQGNGNFSLLVKNSKVLDFDNKRNYFTKQIHSRHHQQRHVQPPLSLPVRRDQIFLDSYKALYFKTAEEMKYGKLNIRFNGEEGVDAGGVTREWFQVLARSMFDPNYALFHPVASDRTTFHPSTLSAVNPEHLLYFKFIGRIIGKALHEGRVLDCHFSRAVYKRILGKSPNLKDLESNDVDYYKSLVWILENDITDILTEEFCVIENEFGEEKIIDLIPNGRNITVTEENKREYVQKLVEYRLTESVKDQLDNFLQGFHDIIPAELVSIFNEQELELLISGLPEIDVDDWKANTEYHNYSPSSAQIVWFWRIVRGMTNEERAKLLQFITGTSKVPLNGFKELEGVSGLTRFNIHKDPSTNRLPTSHTCFNQLDLPTYDSFEVMKQQIMTAISLGADYFGFA